MIKFVWVFNGELARFPAAIFAQKSEAELWIYNNRLTGILTKYPLGQGLLDFCLENKLFDPKDKILDPSFIEGFTSAYIDHFHYKVGTLQA